MDYSLLFIISFLLSTSQAIIKDKPRYRTAYACEGNDLHIECDDGKVINLIRANYGRFSISICNEHGNLDWSVDCTSAKSFFVIVNNCGFKKSCTLHASNTIFDDPCPGTLKYLELHYQCVPESKTSSLSTVRPVLPQSVNGSRVIVIPSREVSTPPTASHVPTHEITPQTQSRPPIIVPLTQLYRSSSTSTTTTSTTTTTTSTTTSTTASADNHIPGENSRDSNGVTWSSVLHNKQNSSQSSDKWNQTSNVNSSTKPPVSVKPTKKSDQPFSSSTVSTTTVRTILKSSSVIPVISDNNVLNKNIESETMGSIGSIQTFDASDSPYCPPVTFRDIRWPPTRTGAVTIESCPPPTHGSAKWECTGTATQAAWVAQPDLSDCTSFWIHNLRSRVESGDSVMSVASELAQKTRSTKLYGGDIIQTIHVLQTLVSKMGASVGDISEEKRHQLVKDLIQSVIEVSSNILESRNKDGWFDLNVHSRRVVASQLIHGLENAALLLAATQNGQYDFNKAHTNVLVSVRLVDAKVAGVREMHFPTEDTVVNTAWMVMQESLTLPLQTSITSSTSKPGVLKVVFLAYRNVQDFLTPLNISSAPATSTQPSSLSLAVPGSVQSPAHPISHSSSMVTTSTTKRVINSKVMTLSLVGETNNAFNIRLAQPIQLQFKHLIEENMSNPQCVYWDYNISEWSSDGCWLMEHNKSHTICNCNHLTSFALLMDFNSGKAPAIVDELSHRYILYIGCFISLAFITVTLVLLLFVWSSYRFLAAMCICQVYTWAMAAAYHIHETTTLAYLFTFGDICQALVLFIYWCAKNDKLKDGIHKSISSAPHWLPECIRGSKPKPTEREAKPGQTAHLFAIAAQNGGVAPPSPMIRASGHHHNGPLGPGLNQAGSLQQLSLPYHYWNTKSAGLPPQYEEHKSSAMRHMEDNNKSLLKTVNRTNSQGFITQGLPSITPDIHLIDSTSYQSQYSPFITSKSLNRRSLHNQQSFGHQLGHQSIGGPVDDHNLSNSFGANNLSEQKPNIIYGRRAGQVIYPGKHGYQIAPEAGDVIPVRPPLPDHIYECIDDDCYCFSAYSGQQRADYRTKKFYREFESPARKHRPPPLRNAVIAPSFREHLELNNSNGSERNLLRTIAASVLNSSGNLSANTPNSFKNNCNKSSNVCADFLLDLSCSSNVDQLLTISNEAIALNNSSSDCSSLDNTSTDTNNANQRSSQQSMTSTGTEGQNPLHSFESKQFNESSGANSSSDQMMGRSQLI